MYPFTARVSSQMELTHQCPVPVTVSVSPIEEKKKALILYDQVAKGTKQTSETGPLGFKSLLHYFLAVCAGKLKDFLEAVVPHL